MPVIINQFDVVPDEQQPPATATQASKVGADPRKLAKAALDAMRLAAERRRRLRAH